MKISYLFLLLILLSPCLSPTTVNGAPVLEDYGSIPLAFTLNQGQTAPEVRFVAQGSGCSLFFTPQGTTFVLSREHPSTGKAAKGTALADSPQAEPTDRDAFAIKLSFAGANPSPKMVGEDRLPWNSNYFIGNNPAQWRTDVPNYARVRLEEVYPDIDLVYYGNQNTVEYDFIVQPGADPGKIRMKYDWGEHAGSSLRLNEKGDLVVTTPAGDIIERKPYCYQVIDGNKCEVSGNYRLLGKNEFTFDLKAYNTERPLVIDPAIVYATLIGGTGRDNSWDIAVDGQGCVYAIGSTSGGIFPSTSGAFDTKKNGITKVFVMKLNESGTGLVYSAFLGGSQEDWGSGIALDNSGNTFVCGTTLSADFPTTVSAYDRSHNGEYDIFVAQLNKMGNGLIYSTFLGGRYWDVSPRLAVDRNGCAYITGDTKSSDFPVTPNSLDQSYNYGEQDAFVTKLNESGTGLVYSTFLGGRNFDQSCDIAVDSNGNAYITGESLGGFPTTPGAFQEEGRGITDAFVTRLNASGSAMVYSTMVGGTGSDTGICIAVDDHGIAYVGGSTSSANFPFTMSAFGLPWNDPYISRDSFVMKLNTTAGRIDFISYIGGSPNNNVSCIALDVNGNTYIAGETTFENFPVTSDALFTYGGGSCGFLSVLDNTGRGVYSTCLGSEGSGILIGDLITGIALDGNKDVYMIGSKHIVPNKSVKIGPAGDDDVCFIKIDFDALNPPQTNTTVLSIQEAVLRGMLNQYCYLWNGSEYIPVGASDHTPISPWSGFWIDVYQPFTLLFSVPANHPDPKQIITAEHVFSPGQYYLSGIPVFPQGWYVSEYFGDDIDGISEQNWRVAVWDSRIFDYRSSDANAFPGLAPGRGFWFIHLSPEDRTVDVTGYPANPIGKYYEVNLTVSQPGGSIHLLANPFFSDLQWDECKVQINSDLSSPAKSARIALEDIRSWQIGLGVQSLDGKARDTYNRAGVILTEGAESRLLNAIELPAPGEYIKLALKDPANSAREALAYDYREMGKSEYTWEVELSTTYSSIDARLSLTGLEQVPEGYTLTLQEVSHKPSTTYSTYTLSEDLTIPLTLTAGTPKKFLLTATAKPTGAKQEQPTAFGISGISPNPFNPSTTITFGLEQAGNVQVKVYSRTGQLIETLANTRLNAGNHTISWNPRGFASGVYFISIESNGKRDSRKVTFMK